jgi:hypothetical protein
MGGKKTGGNEVERKGINTEDAESTAGTEKRTDE